MFALMTTRDGCPFLQPRAGFRVRAEAEGHAEKTPIRAKGRRRPLYVSKKHACDDYWIIRRAPPGNQEDQSNQTRTDRFFREYGRFSRRGDAAEPEGEQL